MRSRAAPVTETQDDNKPLAAVDGDTDFIAHCHTPGRFGPDAVDMDMAAHDRFSGHGPGLEKTGRPQPPVKPHGRLVVDLCLCHNTLIATMHPFRQEGSAACDR